MELMCRVRVNNVEVGLIPSESVVKVTTTEGDEEIVVGTDQIKEQEGPTIPAALLHKGEGKALVELPRESASGRRRVWIRERDLVGA